MRISDWSSDVCSSDLAGKPDSAFHDGADIFARLLGKFACITGLQHFSEARDGCQRSPQFIAHVGNESRLDLIRLLQRGIALAQRLLDAAAVGHVQHAEERIPVRQRNGCKYKTLSIGKCNAAAALLAFDRRSENKFTRSELQSLMRISYAVFCLKKK